MLNFIDKILKLFRPCFSRKAVFQWFVVIVIGLMLRTDHLGVTCVIRDLALRSDCYETMLHFFRASSWTLEDLRLKWFQVVQEHAAPYKEDGFTVLNSIYLVTCLVVWVFLQGLPPNGFVFHSAYVSMTISSQQQIGKETVQAIECHVLLSTIAMGLLQMGALRFSNQMDVARFRYLRTPSLSTVSEATIMCYLRQHIFRLMAESPNLCITRIIAGKQEMPDKYDDLRAS